MATSAPKAAKATDDAAPNSKKKTLLFALIGVLVLGGGGAGAWFFMQNKAPVAEAAAKPVPPAAPVFVPLETFTVNLQSEEEDRYLQTQFTLQVADASQADLIKQFMPQVRSRLLTLLSSKKVDDLKTSEGKQKLSEEILAQVRLPFSPKSSPQTVSDVFFVSFVIQ